MANAAERLHQLLRNWVVPGNESPESARGLTDDTWAFWQRQAEAVRLLDEVEQILNRLDAGGDKTETYRRVSDRWYAAVFGQTAPWSTTVPNTRPIIDDHALDLLEALASVVDSMRLEPIPTGLADGPDALLKVLQEAENLARLDESLTSETQRYVVALILRARSAITNPDAFSPETLRSLTMELGGALMVAATQSTPQHQAKWISYARSTLLLFAVPTMSSITTTLITQAITGTH